PPRPTTAPAPAPRTWYVTASSPDWPTSVSTSVPPPPLTVIPAAGKPPPTLIVKVSLPAPPSNVFGPFRAPAEMTNVPFPGRSRRGPPPADVPVTRYVLFPVPGRSPEASTEVKLSGARPDRLTPAAVIE